MNEALNGVCLLNGTLEDIKSNGERLWPGNAGIRAVGVVAAVARIGHTHGPFGVVG